MIIVLERRYLEIIAPLISQLIGTTNIHTLTQIQHILFDFFPSKKLLNLLKYFTNQLCYMAHDMNVKRRSESLRNKQKQRKTLSDEMNLGMCFIFLNLMVDVFCQFLYLFFLDFATLKKYERHLQCCFYFIIRLILISTKSC